MGEDHPVDDLPGDERDERLGHAAQAGGREREHHVAAVAQHDAPQTPHPAGWSLWWHIEQPCDLVAVDRSSGSFQRTFSRAAPRSAAIWSRASPIHTSDCWTWAP